MTTPTADAPHPTQAELCPICLELFKCESQVLLSCSHVFHEACLRSFENYQGASRGCPVCRRSSYEKRMSVLGEQLFRRKCAVRIQTAFRASRCRRRYAHRRRMFFYGPDGRVLGEDRRRRYMAQELKSLGTRLIDATATAEDSLDSLLAASDEALAVSQQVFARAAQEPNPPPPRPPLPPQSAPAADDQVPQLDQAAWVLVEARAHSRGAEECPICFCGLIDAACRPQTLLSCSHVFHTTCITAFERFNELDASFCPMCRARYTSKPFRR